MKRGMAGTLVVLACLAQGSALGQTFGVTLLPSSELPGFGDPKGSGYGLLTLSGTTISYRFLVQGIQPPTAGYIHSGDRYSAGPVLVTFGLFSPSNAFVDGFASGTVTTTQANVDQIRANPSSFYVDFLTADYPGGALRGELAPSPSSYVYFPTVAKAQGLNNSNFVTDLSIVNRTVSGAGAGGDVANVTLDFFASSPTGLAAPTATKTLAVRPGEQLVLKDLLASQFGVSGDGALRVTTPRNVYVTARVFNDQQAVGAGTTGLLVSGSDISDVAASGVLPLLSNASASETASGVGYRTNIGFFNPYAGAATATFKAIRTTDGTALGSVTRTIPGLSRVQLPVFDLISSVPEADRRQQDFYVTFVVSKGSALFVYAVVVDNKTGDGIYLKAVPSPAGSDPAPAAPPSLAGFWKGGGNGFTMAWHLAQQGDIVTGYVMVEAVNGFSATESLSGTLTGNTLILTGLGLAADNSMGNCVDVVTFNSTVVDAGTIRGRYTEAGTCDPGDSGIFSVVRQ